MPLQHIQRLYADYACMPNMHLHMHLSEIMDQFTLSGVFHLNFLMKVSN